MFEFLKSCSLTVGLNIFQDKEKQKILLQKLEEAKEKMPSSECAHCACLDGLIEYEPVTHVAMQVYVILVQNIGGGGRDDVQYAIHPSLQSQ